MPIRPNPRSRSSPILVRSARHECEAAQLGGLHAEDLKTPGTTPSQQIQILAYIFAYVHAQVVAYVLAYVLTYVFTYALTYVPTSALCPQVTTGDHPDGSGC
jgi:hypothetical protein